MCWCLELPSAPLSFVRETVVVVVVVVAVAAISIIAIVIVVSIIVIMLAIFLVPVRVLLIAGQELWWCIVLAEFIEDYDCAYNVHHWAL